MIEHLMTQGVVTKRKKKEILMSAKYFSIDNNASSNLKCLF